MAGNSGRGEEEFMSYLPVMLTGLTQNGQRENVGT